jgi:ParB family transcriptional regulator, chromosome partitioning protein
MKLQTIKLSETYESENNPRGNEFKGSAFDDLVASVKEKGVLVPVIARPRKKGTKEYEIVAGNRRFRAAQAAGLKEIPARVETLTDEEAQEIQIIENLQREDVHPLEEGQAYRKLVDESKYEIPSVAAKVGKSESYVRQRIFLTHLEAPIANAYRSGKMTDGHAVLIARLSAHDQSNALGYLTQSSYHTPSIADLKDYIEKTFNKPLEHQPWLKDKEAMAAVGPCKECPPNVPSLFGTVKEGACTDTKCWKRKMTKYIAYRKQKTPDLILISKQYNYGSSADKQNGILYSNQYENPGPKDKCTHSVMALVAQGEGLGSMIRICVAKECKTHGRRHSSAAITPAEKAKRAKEELAQKAREEKRKQKDREEIADALKKVKWPMTKKTLDVLFECAFDHDHDLEEICARRGIEGKKNQHGYVDEEQEIRRVAEKMTDAEKAQLVMEIFISAAWDDKKRKLLKSL